MDRKDVAFVHVPKTGTVSIQVVVHRKCVEITHLPDEKMTAGGFRAANHDAFIFAFVRNPFDRLVSAYSYFWMSWIHKIDRQDAEKYVWTHRGFHEFVMSEVASGRVLEQRHFRPQVDWITNAAGEVVVDFLGHFERLQTDFDDVCRRLGWPETNLPSLNRSRHKSYRECYDEEMVRVVVQTYARDFEIGEYETTL